MLGRFGAYEFLRNLVFFEPFFILFLREQGLSFLQIGLLVAVREATTNLLQLPTGVIADMLGRRRAMLASFASFIASFACFYFSREFGLLVVAMLFFGLGEALRSGTHKAMVMEYLDSPHAGGIAPVSVFGVIRSWSQIGLALSAVLSAGLVFWLGQYRVVFLASIIPYVLGILVVATYPRELDGQNHRRPDIQALTRFLSGALRRMFSQLSLRRAILNSSLDKGLYKVVMDYLQPVIAASALLLLPFLPKLLPQAADKQTIAIAVAVIYVVLYLASAAASSQSESLERLLAGTERALNRLFAAYLVVMALACWGLLAGQWWVTVACFLLIGILQNARRPLIITYLGQIMAPAERATVLSVETLCQTVLTMFLAPLIGLSADHYGLASVFVIAIVVFAFFGYLLRFRTGVQEAISA